MVVAFFDWRNFRMNDNNFIEELRQKREEYGVTQTRLTVATFPMREGKRLIFACKVKQSSSTYRGAVTK